MIRVPFETAEKEGSEREADVKTRRELEVTIEEKLASANDEDPLTVHELAVPEPVLKLPEPRSPETLRLPATDPPARGT